MFLNFWGLYFAFYYVGLPVEGFDDICLTVVGGIFRPEYPWS